MSMPKSLKWKILISFVALYLVGIIGAGWHTYDATDSSQAVPATEALKIVFIMLGGLGVIVPTYLNIWQSLETAKLLEDQERRDKIENTFRLLEKWDDDSLFEARSFTRGLGDQHGSLSPDQLKLKINNEPNLRQSIILVFNYFELLRISIENERVDRDIVASSLGLVFHDIYDRVKPWIKDRPQAYQDDLEKLSLLLPKKSS